MGMGIRLLHKDMPSLIVKFNTMIIDHLEERHMGRCQNSTAVVTNLPRKLATSGNTQGSTLSIARLPGAS